MNTVNRNSAALKKFASELISTTAFKKIIKDKDYEFFHRKVKKLEEYGQTIEKKNNKTILKEIYSYMAENYRTEYFYKNTIINELISKKEFVKDAVVVLNEFKIGKSIADLVFINGVDIVFEIKTELDSPDRLYNQICDYRKMFSEIYIVTHHTLLEKYLLLAEQNEIGLIVLDDKLILHKIREAKSVKSHFNILTMMKSIKKSEIINIINKLGVEIPEVPNTIFADSCLEILKSFDINDVHKLVLSELKMRRIKEFKLLRSSKTIKELKHVCINLNFNETEYNALFNFLNNFN